MKRGMRAGGAALITVALVGATGTAVAAAAPGIGVSELSSLRAGTTAGTLHGRVVNRTAKAAHADVTVSLHRRGVERHVVGHASVRVGAKGTAAYRVKVKLPSGLPRGTYYLSSCTAYGAEAGVYGCATAQDEVQIGGGTPVRGTAVQATFSKVARAARAEACGSGAHSLSAPGSRLYPEMGNGGYLSLHSDVYNVYDAPANLFLPGTHVDLTQRSTQCLSDFSLDFERSGPGAPGAPGPDMAVGSVLIDGRPASFKFVQPTYPGDPNGQDDPDPLAHRASNNNPVSATNPNPPACAPTSTAASQNDTPCPANKLVITPSAPIPAGTDFKVTVNYTGRPGIHLDGNSDTEGWFRNDTPVGDGSFVTTEPVGNLAWMPLNNHPTVKPTYDFYDTVTLGRTAIANGRLISGPVDNAPDANFAGRSTTWHWKSPEPIANYLVENSIGGYELTERFASSGVVYYEAQSSGIDPASKIVNKNIMDQQEDITLFQQRFNGPFPFSTDGVIVGIPTAGFEEEMQTKITFQRGSISLGTFNHENMHQWWGDNVSEGAFNLTFFKEGYADLSEGLAAARTAASTNGNGGLGTPSGDAAFEASLVTRFNGVYNRTGSFWTVAPSNPTSSTLFGGSNTYQRPGASYIALRTILGADRFSKAGQEIQRAYGGGSITEPQEIAVFQKWLPSPKPECHSKLDEFFKQWWDTAYPAGGGANKPSITGPGLAGGGFWDDTCKRTDVASGNVSGTVPATLSLTLGAPGAFGPFVPGVQKEYGAQTTANVISTAGDAALTVADPSATAPGHLVNGAFSLPSALQVSATSPAGKGAAAPLGASPLPLLTWTAPVGNDAVAVAFTQTIGQNDALRTGAYSKTLTFTLSTTAP
ncbi:gluzincin family metallopeptidase [Candidatus Solirubrobacter pratensis]|uniref:hypothetical protein n=1 Tax=Candidatus Solirubrobacter pratensis TaxID=1298857 RepID=UPI00041138E2|nr:hypothetical protein [Candidatus Solirubrobacter pratensis]